MKRIIARCRRRGCEKLFIRRQKKQVYCCAKCRRAANNLKWSGKEQREKATKKNLPKCQYKLFYDTVKEEYVQCSLPVAKGNRFLCAYHFSHCDDDDGVLYVREQAYFKDGN